MKNIVGATLSFGLVNLPVGICSTHSEQEVSFKTLHNECGQPVKQLYVCPTCQGPEGEIEVVLPDDQIKGFEFARGQFIKIDKAEMEQFTIPRSAVIEITKFIPESELGFTQIQKSYWLQPVEVLARQYETISLAMLDRKAVAIGKASLWGKERPVAIECYDGVLMLHMLWCADEVKTPTDIVDMLGTEVVKAEKEFAEMYIDAKLANLTAEDLTSETRERLGDYIAAKISNEPVAMPKVEKVSAITPSDMFAALRESVAAAQRETANA
jgi:DNA end-binding protein Ku